MPRTDPKISAKQTARRVTLRNATPVIVLVGSIAATQATGSQPALSGETIAKLFVGALGVVAGAPFCYLGFRVVFFTASMVSDFKSLVGSVTEIKEAIESSNKANAEQHVEFQKSIVDLMGRMKQAEILIDERTNKFSRRAGDRPDDHPLSG